MTPTFDTDLADILAAAAVGWTGPNQCHYACRALSTLDGLDAPGDYA